VESALRGERLDRQWTQYSSAPWIRSRRLSFSQVHEISLLRSNFPQDTDTLVKRFGSDVRDRNAPGLVESGLRVWTMDIMGQGRSWPSSDPAPNGSPTYCCVRSQAITPCDCTETKTGFKTELVVSIACTIPYSVDQDSAGASGGYTEKGFEWGFGPQADPAVAAEELTYSCTMWRDQVCLVLTYARPPRRTHAHACKHARARAHVLTYSRTCTNTHARRHAHARTQRTRIRQHGRRTCLQPEKLVRCRTRTQEFSLPLPFSLPVVPPTFPPSHPS
jgi:hypothetical protein